MEPIDYGNNKCYDFCKERITNLGDGSFNCYRWSCKHRLPKK